MYALSHTPADPRIPGIQLNKYLINQIWNEEMIIINQPPLGEFNLFLLKILKDGQIIFCVFHGQGNFSRATGAGWLRCHESAPKCVKEF